MVTFKHTLFCLRPSSFKTFWKALVIVAPVFSFIVYVAHDENLNPSL